jgi:hypothetical protein
VRISQRSPLVALLALLLLVACATTPTTDTTDPTVTLSADANNVDTAGPLTLTADASDNVGITLVEFFQQPATTLRNQQNEPGTKIGEDDEAPFELTVDLSEDNNGEQTFTAVASDEAGNQGSDSVVVTVDIPVVPTNSAPSFTSPPILGASEGDPYGYNVATTDPDTGNTLAITATTKPDWLTLTDNGDGTATLEGTPDAGDVGAHDVGLRVEDDEGAAATQTFVVTVSATNDPPSFTSAPIESVDEDSAYTYSVTTTDPDVGDTRTVTAPTKPAWLTLTDRGDGTATLEGTPTNGEVGDHDVELRVTDSGGVAATQAFTITVVNTNDAPVAEDDNFSIDEEETLNGNVLGDNGNGADSDVDVGDTLIVNTTPVSGPSNGALTLNGDGSFEYTPNQEYSGSDGFTYELEDTSDATDTATVSITIAVVNDAPTVTTPGDELVIRNTISANDVSVGFTVGDAETAAGSLSVSATSDNQAVVTNADLELNLDCVDGACTLEFTPDASSNASATITLEVSDGVNEASTSFGVDVTSRLVVNTDDSGAGSLRGTLGAAEAGDVVGFSSDLPLQQGDPVVITLTSGELLLDQDVTIEGPGRGSLSIDGSNNSRVLRVESGVSAVVSGVTITGGNALEGGGIYSEGTLTIIESTVESNEAADGVGGGIYNLGTITVDNSTIGTNTATPNGRGGGIFNASGGTVVVQNNSTLSGNVAEGPGFHYGGGINNDGGTITVDGSTISGNKAEWGGGIHNTNSGTITIVNSSITGNTGSTFGGGIYNDDSGIVTIEGSSISDHAEGSGIFNFGGAVTLVNSSVTGNTSGGAGGGISSAGGPVTLVNSTVANNAGTCGGGILNYSLGLLTIDGSTISGNVAAEGGGICNSSTVIIVNNSSITGNTASGSDVTATKRGGGILNFGTVTVENSSITDNSATNNGGGIYNIGTVTVDASSLTSNTATNGGGLYNNAGTATIQKSSLITSNDATNGGGLYANGGTVTIDASTVESNTATDGGGAFTASGGTLNVQNSSTTTSNEATNEGGGIHNSGTLTIDASSITDNTATKGGGLYNNAGTATIQNSAGISNNEATDGAGISNASGATLTTNGIDISFNEATSKGGGIHNAGTATLSNSVVGSNTGSEGGGAYNATGGTLTLQTGTVAITNTASTAGGGIANHGTATVNGSIVQENESSIFGGGIFNNATLTVENSSTVTLNIATSGGGINNQAGTATVNDSDVTENTASGQGGGVFNLALLTLENGSTVASNSAGLGGGIYQAGGSLVGAVAGGNVSGNTPDDIAP